MELRGLLEWCWMCKHPGCKVKIEPAAYHNYPLESHKAKIIVLRGIAVQAWHLALWQYVLISKGHICWRT